MISHPPLLATPQDRISATTQGFGGGANSGWAALGSLLVHGTALAAALIAASGSGPKLPPPAIEISVVIADAPRADAAASKGEATEQSAASAQAVANEAQTPRAEPATSIPRRSPVERAHPEQGSLSALEPDPAAMPARKPDPQPPSESAEVDGRTLQADASQPEPKPSDTHVSTTQLAVLPAGVGPVAAAANEGGVTTAPSYQAGGASNPWPRYPPAARRRGIEGQVLIAVAVDADGRAKHVEILRSSGHSLLDRAAMEALARWRFEPARNAGQAVSGTIEIPVTFRLSDPGGS